MSATSHPLAAAASATGAITLVVLIAVGVVAVLLVTALDRARWNPWAQRHGLHRSGTIRPESWGDPFRDEFRTENPFSGTVHGLPVTVAEYWHALDYDAEGGVKGKRRIQVCVLSLGRPLGRLHIRNRTRPGPLANTVEAGGVPIGHPGFDARYAVTVDDPQLRGHLLTRAVVDFLAAAPDVAAIRVVDDQLVIVGVEAKQQREHLDVLVHVADGLAARLPAGIGQRTA